MKEAAKEEGESGPSQGLALTGINTDDTTGETSQPGLKRTQVTNGCGTSSSHDEDKTSKENSETNGQAGLSLQSVADVPSSDKELSEGRSKKSKIRYEINRCRSDSAVLYREQV